MRLAPTLLLPSLAAILVPFVSAHGRTGHHTSSRSLSRLQHHESRDLINLCVNIPDLIVNVLGLLGLGANICLCIDDLDIYLKANANVTLQGQALAQVNALINTGGNSKGNCGVLPAHAKRTCSTSDPCDFTCHDGYTRQGDQCVCLASNLVCNGQCVPSTAGCGASQAARSMKSRRGEIDSYTDAKAYCGEREVCGVYNPDGADSKGWECVDVMQTSGSCGGCVYDHPFLPKSVAPLQRGTDCGEGVDCRNGNCVVQKRSFVTPARIEHTADYKLRRDLLGSALGPITSGLEPTLQPVTNAVVSGLSSSLGTILGAVANAAQGLSSSAPASGCVNASSVAPALISINAVIGSPPNALVVHVKVALGLLTKLLGEAHQCGGAGGPLDSLVQKVGDLLNSLTGLLNACSGGVPTVPSAPSDKCLAVHIDKLLCAVVCGELGEALSGLLQPLVNGLGLGPSESCPRASSSPMTPNLLPASPASTSPSAVAGAMANVINGAHAVASNLPAGCVDASPLLISIKAVVGSPPPLLVLKVEVALGEVSKLLGTAQHCGGGGTGGGAGGLVGNLVQALSDLLKDLTGLLNVAPGGMAPSTPSDKCLAVHIHKLLCAVVCGQLGELLEGLLQPLVNGLGIGPSGSCPPQGAAAPSAGVSFSAPSAAASSSASAPSVAPPSTDGNPPPADDPINIAINLKRRAFRTRSGHFTRADTPAPEVLAPAMISPIMQTLTLTVAITEMGAPNCGSLLSVLARVLTSSSPIALRVNLEFARSTAQALKDSLASSGSASAKLGQLVDQLITTIEVMRANKSPTVPQSAKCPPSADAGQPVCGFGVPVSELIRCGCGNQKLSKDAQDILGRPIPLDKECPALSLSPASHITTSLVPAVVSPVSKGSNDKVIAATNALLVLCLRINLAGGNMPFRTAVISKLNAVLNRLLVTLLGEPLLEKGSHGLLGGSVAKILLGQNKLTANELNKLVATAVDLAKNAGASPQCGCSDNSKKLVGYLQQVPGFVKGLQDAVKGCGCQGKGALTSVTDLFSAGAIQAFEMLKE
ncbi:hypothetical protein DFH08DRAFT_394120 [Mycena albidolilacea]|uniref:Uncharacterized protein n=1 Tax=Mycena albidolilacea TaxID=1033008 RepID=A0AAD6ZEN7_9AGAR|nr:hypothetical protein DFH08DRAFT_394120 [Mycena albidolilacea]